MKLLFLSYALLLVTSKTSLGQDIPECVSATGNYTVILDLYAGELGALCATIKIRQPQNNVMSRTLFIDVAS